MRSRIVKYSATVLVLGILNVGWAGASTVSSTACPSILSEYKEGETTATEVKRCLGDPVHEDHNSDGRFVYVYSPDEKTMATFLFDSSEKLIRIRSYSKK